MIYSVFFALNELFNKIHLKKVKKKVYYLLLLRKKLSIALLNEFRITIDNQKLFSS